MIGEILPVDLEDLSESVGRLEMTAIYDFRYKHSKP